MYTITLLIISQSILVAMERLIVQIKDNILVQAYLCDIISIIKWIKITAIQIGLRTTIRI